MTNTLGLPPVLINRVSTFLGHTDQKITHIKSENNIQYPKFVTLRIAILAEICKMGHAIMPTPADYPLLFCEPPNAVPWPHLFHLYYRRPTCYNVKKNVCLLLYLTLVYGWAVGTVIWTLDSDCHPAMIMFIFGEVYGSDSMTRVLYFCATSN